MTVRQKLVDGVLVDLSPAENAARDVEEAAFAIARREADITVVKAEMLLKRETLMLPRLASIQTDALANSNTALALEASTLRENLLGIMSTDLSACETREDMRTAFKLAWAAMAKPVSKPGGTISLELYNAWKAIDQ